MFLSKSQKIELLHRVLADDRKSLVEKQIARDILADLNRNEGE